MDNLTRDLFTALEAIPLIDPHSHIEPLAAASKSLDDILGYHYYTELAHSAGMPQACLAKDYPKRERCREIIRFMSRYDNCEQSRWFDVETLQLNRAELVNLREVLYAAQKHPPD